MQGQLKYYVSTSSNLQHDIYGKPIAVSCASYEGMEKVSKAIKGMSAVHPLLLNKALPV